MEKRKNWNGKKEQNKEKNTDLCMITMLILKNGGKNELLKNTTKLRI